MTKKLDINKYIINKFHIGSPKKTKIGLNLTINYDTDNFSVQTPVCKLVSIDCEDKSRCVISFIISKNFQYFQFFLALEEKIKQDCNNKYIDKQSYISSIKNYENSRIEISIKLNTKTVLFDKKKEPISRYSLRKGDKVILLLETKGIWIDEVTYTMKWNAIQIVKL